MKIGFGCDHAAIDLKNELIKYMTEKGYECVDYGTGYDENGEIIKCDYPNKGREVGEAVENPIQRLDKIPKMQNKWRMGYEYLHNRQDP